MAIPNNAVLQDDRLSRIELKLYRSANYPTMWLAFSQETGWLMFPSEVGGWEKRQPTSGIDKFDLRELPLRMGFNTGIPGAPTFDRSSDQPFRVAA